MPRMDGITFLQKDHEPAPYSRGYLFGLVSNGCETTLKALEYGAVEIIEKPRMGDRAGFLKESRVLICDAVRAASVAHLQRISTKTLKVAPETHRGRRYRKPGSKAMFQTTEKVVVVGASTGGTERCASFLRRCPWTRLASLSCSTCRKTLRRRLRNVWTVYAGSPSKAGNDDTVIRGRALIAPGNRHTLLKRAGHGTMLRCGTGIWCAAIVHLWTCFSILPPLCG